MDYILFLDTNALLNLQENCYKEHFVISQKTLEEVESIKSSGHKDGEVKYKARKASHLLDENNGKYTVVPTTESIKQIIHEKSLEETPDNIILAAAYQYNRDVRPVLVVSDDVNAKFISREIYGLETKGTSSIHVVTDGETYTGFKDIILSDEEMSEFYSTMDANNLECKLNEYVIIRKSDGEVVDYRKWDGTTFKALKYNQIKSTFLGKIKPINPQQILAFDMLQNQDITIKVLVGKAGSGKDYVMIANALKLIEEGKYDKLLYIRNAVTVKDANDIGFLPGDKFSKLSSFAAPLADHLGGEIGLEKQMFMGNIEIEHLGYIRGRDIKNTIIYCSEAENLTKEHVQLLISRVGQGSSIWLNGDFKQVDSPIFRLNNGLLTAVERLAGLDKFGYVQLEKTERSETAQLADLLD